MWCLRLTGQSSVQGMMWKSENKYNLQAINLDLTIPEVVSSFIYFFLLLSTILLWASLYIYLDTLLQAYLKEIMLG